MIIYVFPADNYGCGHYRLAWPALALRAQGHDVRLVPPTARNGIGGDIDSKTGRLVNVQIPPDADVIVMQRVSLAHLVAAVPMIRARGVAVVVDMDDDLTKIDPSNPAFWAMRADSGDRRHTWRNAHQACLDATLVTVSTPALLPIYAPHGRGVVIANRVPARYLDIPREDSAAIGWPGSTHSHPLDLQEVGPSVARLLREGHTYRGVGPPDGLREALGLEVEPEVTGSVELDDWPHELARIGVGLAPLADTEFNRAKSGLKPLELMACGVPWVASPRAEYVKLHRATGVGLLADRPKDWYRQVKRLATDPGVRAAQSAAGRAAAAGETIEGNAWRWLEVWEQAVAAQRSGRPVPLARV
jgi:glycosyltransferase involved in cell wall biosynthesis